MLKENLFLIGLGASTAVISGGLIFWGISAGSALEEAQTEIESKKSDLTRMQRLDPYPTPENAQAKTASVAEVIEAGAEARAEFLKFNPESLNDIPGSEFSETLKSSVSRVVALFPEEKALPDDFTMGFEAYANYLPPEDATGELAFQVGAMEHLLTELANSGVSKVLNLYRAELPMEDGKDWDGSPLDGSSKSRKGPNRRPKMSPGGRPGRKPMETLPEIAHRMPVELTFRGTEVATREFLTRLGNSEDYFFQVRLARVENPAPIPSSKDLETAGSASGGAGDIVIEGGDEIVVEGGDDIVVEGGEGESAPAEPTLDASPVLEKVSGGEDLNVFLKLDLLLFLESKEFPEAK